MYAVNTTIDEVIEALAVVLTPFIENSQIVRAQVNRVAMPPSPCVVLTELLAVDLAVPFDGYPITALATTAAITSPTRIDVQIDFYGEKAGDFCKTMQTIFRSFWAFDQFPINIKPLYTSNGIQAPLITGEEQYESRWTLTVSMQYNPIVTVPQDFAAALSPLIPIIADT